MRRVHVELRAAGGEDGELLALHPLICQLLSAALDVTLLLLPPRCSPADARLLHVLKVYGYNVFGGGDLLLEGEALRLHALRRLFRALDVHELMADK